MIILNTHMWGKKFFQPLGGLVPARFEGLGRGG